jgi:hypothetical protein
MAKRYFELSSTGLLQETGNTKAMVEAALTYKMPATEFQQLTGNGAVELDKAHVRLNSAVGSYVVTLGDGTEEHEEQWIFFVGTGGSWSVTGNFRGFTSLQFDVNADCAMLKWVANKWTMVSGNARQI